MASITITGKIVNASGLPEFVADNTLKFQLAFAKFVNLKVRVKFLDGEYCSVVFGQVINNNGKPKFLPKNINTFQNALKKFVGKEVKVLIEENVNIRSSSQNRYYHGVIVKTITLHLNKQRKLVFSKKEVHNFLLQSFCPEKEYEIRNILNGTILFGKKKSTTLLNTKETQEYYEECCAWAATNLGLTIPLPNE